jgi:hypothetical protein
MMAVLYVLWKPDAAVLCAGAESTLLGCFRRQVDKWSVIGSGKG